MEFRHINLYTVVVALSATAFCGCSSSDGNVDYASIDKPAPADSSHAQTDNDDWQPDTTSDEVAVAAETHTASASADAQPAEDKTSNLTNEPPPPEQVAENENAKPAPPTEPDGVKMVSNTDNSDGSVQVAVANMDSTADPESKTELPEDPQKSAGPKDDPEEETPAEPREIKLLIPEHRFRSEGDDGSLLRISYDDIDLLKVLNMEPVPVNAPEYFPQWLKDLDGQRIRLRGFMYPTFVATGITNFGLARDNGICCFVKQPKIYDMIEVSLAENESTDYIEGKPFDVEGTFRIDPEADDTELFQLYRIEDAKVLKP